MAPCNHPGCMNTVSLAKWSTIKSNWFFSKGGRAYCPEHIPEWVLAWRKKNSTLDA